jgi:serine/threonine protein kinase
VAIGPSRDPCHGGAFADIYRGRYEGSEVAVKKLRFFGNQKAHIHQVGLIFFSQIQLSNTRDQAFCKEALVWRQMAHPNVLPFIGVDAETFADTGFLCMISPWMANGSLLDYRRSESYDFDHDTSRIVRPYFTFSSKSDTVVQLWEISCGLAYLHGQKVVHGDIHVVRWSPVMSTSP